MSATEQDRERAAAVLAAIRADAHWITSITSGRREPVDAIAKALAKERDRARAPFRALAEDFDGATFKPHINDFDRGLVAGYAHVADRIRRAAKESQ